MMKWEKLLQRHRQGDQPSDVIPDERRSDFERDFDRVVFSSAFRRMQDKTQVVPLPESDFVHTRLTHSIEVSSVGRSLGKQVGQLVLERKPYLATEYNLAVADFGAIVAAASLAHDIGNPPFGHSGERAISEYFLNGRGGRFQRQLSEKQWNDFIRFEGNANGFRALTNYSSGAEGGLRLTYPVLATFTKYPKESLPHPIGFKRTSDKKYGFFQSERELFRDVAEVLELKKKYEDEHYNWCRHPLAFLVEAADDICYSIIDFEDGLRLGLIEMHCAKEMLKPIVGTLKEEFLAKLRDPREKVGYLRAKAINSLVGDLSGVFLRYEDEILSGSYDHPLIKESRFSAAVEAIKEITKERLYKSRSVLEIEAAGFEVLGGLLDLCITAVNDEHDRRCGRLERSRFHSEKLIELIPEQFIGEGKVPSDDLYMRLMRICEYVAGMTDSFAISLFRKVKGNQLPR